MDCMAVCVSGNLRKLRNLKISENSVCPILFAGVIHNRLDVFQINSSANTVFVVCCVHGSIHFPQYFSQNVARGHFFKVFLNSHVCVCEIRSSRHIGIRQTWQRRNHGFLAFRSPRRHKRRILRMGYRKPDFLASRAFCNKRKLSRTWRKSTLDRLNNNLFSSCVRVCGLSGMEPLVGCLQKLDPAHASVVSYGFGVSLTVESMEGIPCIPWGWTFFAALKPLEEVFLGLSKGFLCWCWCHVVLGLRQQRLTEENLKHRIPFDKKMFTKSENTFKPSRKRRKHKGLLRTIKATSTSKRAIRQGKEHGSKLH